MPSAGQDEYEARRRRRHWLDHAAVWAATFAAFAAACAAGAGFWQAWVAKDTASRQLRAYVGVIQNGVENFGDETTQFFKITRKNLWRDSRL